MKTLNELRSGFSLTQEELAKLFQVSTRTIQHLEKDSTNIKDPMLKKYINFFNVSYDDIFLGNEYEKNVFIKNRKKEAISNIRE